MFDSLSAADREIINLGEGLSYEKYLDIFVMIQMDNQKPV
jgi:hypothetical protein